MSVVVPDMRISVRAKKGDGRFSTILTEKKSNYIQAF